MSTRSGSSGRTPPHVVVELFEESAALLRNARALTALRHPKLVPAREVVVHEGLVALETDYVEGEWLADLLEAGSESSRMPLGALLRVLVNVLEGLSALHGARGAAREPLHLLHGEVAPSNVLVGADGKARLVHLLRGAPAPTPSPEVTGYLAPEVLLSDQSADARADIFSVGVLLWEILSGRRLHPATHAGEIVVRLLGGKVQLAEAPKDSPWAQPLAQVARRALSPALAERYATATEMAGAVRRIAGARLASSEDVRALVESLAGARIRARASGAKASRPLAAIAQREAAVAPTAEPRAPSVRPDTPTLVPPRSLPAPPLETASVLRAAPPAPPPSVAAAPEAIELEVEPDSERPAARASPEPRVAPRAPPLPRISVPRLSIPTPIMPVAAFARSLARSAPDEQDPAPSFPPPASAPAPVAPVVTPLAAESAPEATDAPIALAAWSPDAAGARARRPGRLLMVAAVVVVLPAIAGLVALGRARGATDASAAKGAVESARTPTPLAAAHLDGVVELPVGDAPAATSAAAQPASSSVAESPAPLEAGDAAPPAEADGANRAPRATEAATSVSDPIAPPPLPKKSKKTYYPLGI